MVDLKFKRVTPLASHTSPKKKYVISSFDTMGSPDGFAREIKRKSNTIMDTPKISTPVPSGREIWVSHDIIYNNRTGNNTCAVVIPVYKTFDNLKNFEQGSIRQVIKILGGKYNLILIHPENLDITGYNVNGYTFSSLAMNPAFFKRQKSYSNLCERYEFYEAFSEYEFMLIYQTDAWIFRDEIQRFCDMDYDYIGGVHLIGYNGNGGENGNGGFSLRKIKKFIDVCRSVNWKDIPAGQLEDCAFTQKLKKHFNLAPVSVCFEFSWHEKGGQCYNKIKKLPMGCHAFKIHDWAFWSKHIGY